MKKKNKGISIINKDCNLKGDLEFRGYLILAGSIEGNLTADSVATEKDSYIKGKVNAQTLTIAGSVEGEITVTDTLTLLDTANVKALIRYEKLILEKGCVLNCRIAPLRSDAGS